MHFWGAQLKWPNKMASRLSCILTIFFYVGQIVESFSLGNLSNFQYFFYHIPKVKKMTEEFVIKKENYQNFFFFVFFGGIVFLLIFLPNTKS